MATEILIQILVGVSIVAVIILALVLIFSFRILRKIDDITKVVNNRVQEVDSYLSNLEKLVSSYVSVVKSVANSFDTFKDIGEKISRRAKKYSKGEEDE